MNIKNTVDPLLFVETRQATKEEILEYQKKTNTFSTSLSSDNKGAMQMQLATIKHTFDQENYPVNSKWAIGDAPSKKANLFGEPLEIIETRNLYARVE